MTSAKAKANRTNARASTGPKTTQGKIRAAQNARRHGLSRPILADPPFRQKPKISRVKLQARRLPPKFLNSRAVSKLAETDVGMKAHRLGMARRRGSERKHSSKS
jgi:hypothetical protein